LRAFAVKEEKIYFYKGLQKTSSSLKAVMLKEKNNLIIYLLITLGGILLFLPFLGNVPLFDWDEINFAEIAREMIVTKDYLNVQIDFQPFWEKPPLFIWMQVVSMKLFGINEFAARFPNAICGIATLLVIYSIGKRIYSEKMGIIWVFVYAGSILPFFYFKSGIIDPWFNLFIFTGIYFAVIYIYRASDPLATKAPRHQIFNSPNRPIAQSSNHPIAQSPNRPIAQSPNRPIAQSPNRPIFLSGLCIGLAILTKGPVALLIFGLTGLAYLVVVRFRVNGRFIHVLIFLGGLILTGGSWFVAQIVTGHTDVVKDFIIYQARLFSTKDAGHGGFPGYHVVVLLFGVFPASAFLFNGFKASPDEQPLQKKWRKACIILLLTVVVLFEIVQTKIIHYSSLAYFPMTFLSALAILRVTEDKGYFTKTSAIVLSALAILWLSAIIGLTMAGLHMEWLMNSGIIHDKFAVANLAADVHWSGLEGLVSSVMVIGITGFFLLKKSYTRIITLFTSTIIFTFLTMVVFTGKIEGYSQQAPIDFYQQHSKEDCYINTLGFKSYAHLFYGEKLPPKNPLSYDKEWLLNGQIDKPAYFVFKITKKDEYSWLYPQLNLLYEKNGFIFAGRYPEKPKTGL
jgi:4-amino-4-deoxy-L-arabinose transferase-like glycosyltransferase